MANLRIFLSSTALDLDAHRRQVHEAIDAEDGWTCVCMDDFGAVNATPADHDGSQVARCDLLVGLVGLRHGNRPPGENRSFTECEYDAAVLHTVPRLMFVAPDDFLISGAHRETDKQWQLQQAFRERVRRERVVGQIQSPAILAAHVRDAIKQWLREERLLRLPQRHWRPELDPPGAMLRPECGIVPFHERESELADLAAWADDPQTLLVRLYTGAGGMGKTRLAIELCLRLRPKGWLAGFLDHRAPAPTEGELVALALSAKPVLIVLDYAETARDLVVRLAAAALRRRTCPMRLMLLARHAGDWWEALKREPRGVGDIFFGRATQRVPLKPLTLTPEGRCRSYRLALDAFCATLTAPRPEVEPADYNAPWLDRVLMLHMEALMQIDSGIGADEYGILDHHLARERRFWESLAERYGLPGYVVAGMGRAMAAITLGGGADDESEAADLIRTLRIFIGTDESILRGVARALHDSYPGEKWIEPVLPDLLAEHLVERALEDDPQELYTLTLGPQFSTEDEYRRTGPDRDDG